MNTSILRPSGRKPDELRPIEFIRHYTQHAEGSVLVCFGNTKVLCTASAIEGVPRFLKDSNKGWLTAEYGMLPRATHVRIEREASRGKQTGRTIEIQRLIGRALRGALDLTLLRNYTIVLDCDVIQADGGTRTAAISGACVALADALHRLLQKGIILKNPLKYLVAAISVGIYENTPILDLEYIEDSNAHTDMNVVMTSTGNFLEIQGTAESQPFNDEELNSLLTLARYGIQHIIRLQQQALADTLVSTTTV